MTEGLSSRSTVAEASTELSEFTGLLRSLPACRNENISTALTTEGDIPVMNANSHRINIVIMTLRILFFPFRKKRMLKIK